MKNFFYTGHRRRVIIANFNLYENGAMHPDRVLGVHDIFYLAKGGWEIGQDNESYSAEQGDVVILHAGHRHYGIKDCLPGTKSVFMHISALPEDCLANESDIIEKEYMLSMPVIVKCQDAVNAISILDEIFRVFISDLPNKSIKLSALVEIFLYELALVGNHQKIIKVVAEALNKIRSNPESIFTIKELSEHLHVDARSLTKKFKEQTGKTIHQFQLDLKLETAYMQIKDNPNKPFREIATNLGFYDEFHFSKLFKSKYGYSPKKLKIDDLV